MQYRLPTLSDEKELIEYVKEHYENGEHSISASLGLPVMNYYEWVNKIQTNAKIGDNEWGKSLLFICRDHERIIGLLSIRYELSNELSARYGDIGYGVRPSERRKGYASEMMRFALTVCKEHGMKKVIIGCYKDNLASASLIKKCNGILVKEDDSYQKGKISEYYSIVL